MFLPMILIPLMTTVPVITPDIARSHELWDYEGEEVKKADDLAHDHEIDPCPAYYVCPPPVHSCADLQEDKSEQDADDSRCPPP